MRRFAILLAAPVLLSAADPLQLAERDARAAEREQQRLEREAADARGAASGAAAAAAAAAQAMLAADARIAASELRLGELDRRRQGLEARLAEARRPATALLAGLVQLGRRPQWLALAGSRDAEEQVRLAALVRALRPEIDRRTAGLRGEYDGLRQLALRQQQVRAQLDRDRRASADARARFAALEREKLATAEQRGRAALYAGDKMLGAGERLATLRSESERRRSAAQLAAALNDLPEAAPRPAAPEESAPAAPFAWIVPASGRVTIGLGELMGNGVRARGLTIAAAAGTEVVAPAAGRIVFAGPFRRRAGVVIVDHGGGWLTLLSEVRPSVKVGGRVEAGQALGRALGPVTAELFQDGTAEPAALIARSS